MAHGQFVSRLTAGLAKLSSLRSVTLEGQWQTLRDLDQTRQGSITARRWPHFYVKPESWHLAMKSDPSLGNKVGKKALHAIESYRSLICALAQANNHITSFSLGTHEPWSSGIHPYAFDTSSMLTRVKSQWLASNISIFANLEYCVMNIESLVEEPDEGDATAEVFKNIGTLPILLDSMDRLKHLVLRLPNDLGVIPVMYSATQALPKEKTWLKLQSLVLENMSISAVELLNLVLYRMPALHHLEIGGINLVKGSWEAFFAALSMSNKITYFEFEQDTYLYHRDGEDLFEDADLGYEPCPLYEALENYIQSGGRHPCLAESQPDCAAVDYLAEFDMPFRRRLIHLGEING